MVVKVQLVNRGNGTRLIHGWGGLKRQVLDHVILNWLIKTDDVQLGELL